MINATRKSGLLRFRAIVAIYENVLIIFASYCYYDDTYASYCFLTVFGCHKTIYAGVYNVMCGHITPWPNERDRIVEIEKRTICSLVFRTCRTDGTRARQCVPAGSLGQTAVSWLDYTRAFRHIFRLRNSYDKGEMPPACNGRAVGTTQTRPNRPPRGLNRLGAVRRRDTCYPAAETTDRGGGRREFMTVNRRPHSGHRPFPHKVPRCLWKLSLLKYTVFNTVLLTAVRVFFSPFPGS